jgi:predicted secreted protein
MAEIQGRDIVLSISTDSGTTYKTLICLETLTIDQSSSITERETRCGTKVGISNNKVSISGTFVQDTAPSGTEVSGSDMRTWKNNNTLLDIKAAHVTTPANYFVQMDAYLESLSENAPSDDVLDASFTFRGTGTIDITP